MACSCDGHTSGDDVRGREFDRFWPQRWAFPPSAPYLASLDRPTARARWIDAPQRVAAPNPGRRGEGRSGGGDGVVALASTSSVWGAIVGVLLGCTRGCERRPDRACDGGYLETWYTGDCHAAAGCQPHECVDAMQDSQCICHFEGGCYPCDIGLMERETG